MKGRGGKEGKEEWMAEVKGRKQGTRIKGEGKEDSGRSIEGKVGGVRGIHHQKLN